LGFEPINFLSSPLNYILTKLSIKYNIKGEEWIWNTKWAES